MCKKLVINAYLDEMNSPPRLPSSPSCEQLTVTRESQSTLPSSSTIVSTATTTTETKSTKVEHEEGENATTQSQNKQEMQLAKPNVDVNTLRKKLGAKSGWDAVDETDQFQTYMKEKSRKLDAQYVNERKAKQKVGGKTQEKESKLFNKVRVWVNGLTSPSRLQIRQLMLLHGGKLETYFNPSVTHVIADRLSAATLKRFKSGKNNVKMVNAKWISSSIERNSRLEEWKFPIPGMSNRGQSSIAEMLTTPPKAKFKPDVKVRTNTKKPRP